MNRHLASRALLTVAVAAAGLAVPTAVEVAATASSTEPAPDSPGPEVTQVVVDRRDGSSESYFVITDPDGTMTRLSDVRGRALLREQDAKRDAVATAAPPPTAHRVYVAFVEGGDYSLTENGDEKVWIDSALDYWVGQSDGVIPSMERMGEPKEFALRAGTDCANENAMWEEAAQQFPGVVFTTNPNAPEANRGNHLLVVPPSRMNGVSCEFGIGSNGTNLASGGRVVARDSQQLRAVLAHEIGHNVSLRHARSQDCRPLDDTTCTPVTYGNDYDLMSVSYTGVPPSLSSFERTRLDIADQCEIQQVALGAGQQTVTATYDLFPRGSSAETRGLRVVDPVTGRVYHLDWRTKTGLDDSWPPNSTYPPGVTLERVTAANDQTDLLPVALTSDDDPVWAAAPGVTRATDNGGFSFTVDATDVPTESGATAQVTVTLTDPSVPAGGTLPEQTGTVTLPSLVTESTTIAAQPVDWSAASCFRYLWSIDGTPITADRGSTLSIPAGTTGQVLTLTVIGQQPGYAPRTASVSRTIGTPEPEPTQEPTPTPTPTPAPTPTPLPTTGPTVAPAPSAIAVAKRARVVGKARVGRNLKARARFTPTTVTLSYRWYVGKKLVTGKKGARATFRVRRAYLGKRIRVVVNASAPGLDPVRSTSKRTTKVVVRPGRTMSSR